MPGPGRPLKYKQPKKIMEIGEQFFKECDEKNVPYTITGLALALGISRQNLCEYAARPEYSDTIRKLKQRVEASVEQLMLNKGHAGSIFWMKNHDWTDKTVQEVHNIEEMTQDQLNEKLQALQREALKDDV